MNVAIVRVLDIATYINIVAVIVAVAIIRNVLHAVNLGSCTAQSQTAKRKQSNTNSAEARAAKVMKQFNECLVSSRQILQWIKEGKHEWDWANTEKTLTPFEDAVKSLDDPVNNMSDHFETNYVMGEKLEMELDEKERQFTNLADKFELLAQPCRKQLDRLKSNPVLRREMGLA